MTSGRVIRAPLRRSVTVALPPSKSYTNRALIAASLAQGDSVIRNPSRSLDTTLLLDGLRAFGIGIEDHGGHLAVRGTGGDLQKSGGVIHLGNAGTAFRFLTALATLAPGETILTGDDRMLQRPIGDLVETLRSMGAGIECRDGFPPVRVRGGKPSGNRVTVRTEKSSQFLSALLLISPCLAGGMSVETDGPTSSRPYVGMTLQVMRHFGAEVEADENAYRSPRRTRYHPADFAVEQDFSSATALAAAAAVARGTVCFPDLPPRSLQGDSGFFSVAESMGCRVHAGPGGRVLSCDDLTGTTADMNDIPDSVPAVAVMAAFASGTTTLSGIRHLRYKETDRLAALSAELRKIGANVRVGQDGLTVIPGDLHPGVIETYRDHRMAMSFAAAGLGLPGTTILDPDCVVKSFPDFWKQFDKFYEPGEPSNGR